MGVALRCTGWLIRVLMARACGHSDLSIALEESARMNLALPGLALANQLYLSVKAQGHGLKGTHALALALEHLNGMPSDARK